MLAFCDVQEDTVDEEQEGLNVQMLAPTEAEVEEKLAQTLVIDACFGLLFELLNFFLPDALISLLDLLTFCI